MFHRQTPPAPRFDHTAAVNAGRYLLVFGGCSHSIFFNDFHMEWTQPEIQGDLVTPRAGHAGVTIVFVMRLKPRDTLRPKISAAASVTAAYAWSKSEKLDASRLEANWREQGKKKPSEEDLTIEIDTIKEDKKILEVSLADVRAENSRLREKIDEVNSTHADLSKELHSVQGQLVTERSRCFKLEAQIAELQKALESLESIENEVQLLRRQKSVLEQEIEMNDAAQKQGSGVWRWIAG
ncbi:unnamed protein product [Linum tenue]|uniref:Acyl-CoA-binding domain-containing protein n=1 Tax=Linum tenue TaxID=586396 RepID=A0AAV0JMX6_9ROSI|nr:unnamed protein product [Linum tenue]